MISEFYPDTEGGTTLPDSRLTLNELCCFHPFTPKSAKDQTSKKSQNIEKQMIPCESSAEKVSFEWSHCRISSTDSKDRTTLHVSMIDSKREKPEMVGSREY